MKNNFFRKIPILFLTGTMLLGVGCKDYDDDIDSINKKIDDIEKVKLPGIEEQIEKVKASIPDISQLTSDVAKVQKDLGTASATLSNLKTTVDGLPAKFNELTAKFTEVNGKFTQIGQQIATLTTDLGKVEEEAKKYSADKAGLATAGDITKLRSELQDKIAALNTTLTNSYALKSDLDAYLREGALDGYLQEGDLAGSETIKAIEEAFKSADKTLSSSISDLDGKIDDLSANIAWQGKTFDQYVTELGYVKTVYTDEDAQQAAIDAITKDNQKYNETYVNALVDLVNNAVGNKDGEKVIKVSDLAARQKEYKEALDALTARVDALSVKVEDLVKRIQSIQYVPDYDDGKATVAYSMIGDEIIYSEVKMTYEVRPADAAKTLAGFFHNGKASYFSYKLEQVATRAAAPALNIIDMKADETGRFTVTATVADFAEGFTAASPTVSYSAALSIEVPNTEEEGKEHADGISRTTAYTNLTPKADMVLVYALKNTTEGSSQIVKEGQSVDPLHIEFDNTAGVKPMAAYAPVYCDTQNGNKLYTAEELAEKGYTVAAYSGFEVAYTIKDKTPEEVTEAEKSPFAVTEGDDPASYIVAMKASQTAEVKGYTWTGNWVFKFGEGELKVSNVITVGGTVVNRTMADQTLVWNYNRSAANAYDSQVAVISPIALGSDGKLSTEHVSFKAMLSANPNSTTITVTEIGQENAIGNAATIEAAGDGDDANKARILFAANKIEWGKSYKVAAKYEFDNITYNLTLASVELDGPSAEERALKMDLAPRDLVIDKGTGDIAEEAYGVDQLYTANKAMIDKYFGEDAAGKDAQKHFAAMLSDAVAAADYGTPTTDRPAPTASPATEPAYVELTDASTKLIIAATATPATDAPYVTAQAQVGSNDVAKIGEGYKVTYKTTLSKELNGMAFSVEFNNTVTQKLPKIEIALDPASAPEGKTNFDAVFTDNVFGLSKANFPTYFIVKVSDKEIAAPEFQANGIELDYGDATVASDGTLTYEGKKESVEVTATVEYHGILTARSQQITVNRPYAIFKNIKFDDKQTVKYVPGDKQAIINLEKKYLSVSDNDGKELIIENGDGSEIFAAIAAQNGKPASEVYGAEVIVGDPVISLANGQPVSSTTTATKARYAITVNYPETAGAEFKLTIPVTIKSKYMDDQKGNIVIKLVPEAK
ncbi:hypothetical protein [Alistipes sp.]|uniref:hypothetical protein n=1 Tax=Alistipes sp. TaxID=1872444 RepID=UPI003AEFBE0B